MPHTPEPWTLDAAGWPLVVNGPEPDGPNVICTVEGHEVGGSEYQYDANTAEANARVIVASPTLLRLLKTYHIAFRGDHIVPHEGTDCFHCEAAAVLKEIHG